MTEKKLFGFIDMRPLIWLHYLMLWILISLWFGTLFTTSLIIVLVGTLFIGIADQIIHKILGVD